MCEKEKFSSALPGQPCFFIFFSLGVRLSLLPLHMSAPPALKTTPSTLSVLETIFDGAESVQYTKETLVRPRLRLFLHA
jgi:hypothetical protein